MIEPYIKGKSYPVGTILKWSNGTHVQVQANGSHKIIPKQSLTPNVTHVKNSRHNIIKPIIKHIPGTKHPEGTLVQLKNGALVKIGKNGAFKFVYSKTRTRSSKRKQMNRIV